MGPVGWTAGGAARASGLLFGLAVLVFGCHPPVVVAAEYRVGLGRVDITPDHPIRLAGYASRQTESEGVEQRLWAKALAIEDKEGGPAVLVSAENCVVPASVTQEVARRLQARARIPRERVAICSTHTHTGPYLAGALVTMFGRPIPDEQRATIDRYTQKLVDHLERAALLALADRQPAALDWGRGKAGFATNRRARVNDKIALGVNPEGPVDRSLPALRVTDAHGRLRAVLLNYACHCTTLDASFNRICGDWAGYAQEYIERDQAGALCLVTIGCGADADPQPRRQLEFARQHGQEIATEVNRILKGTLNPIQGKLFCRLARVNLPFDEIPDRDEWEKRARRDDFIGYHARVQLARLDRGEPLQTELDYAVQAWAFGDDLVMVFLAGEVVVDYSLRLKKELDGDRLWVTAYANDVPCYIPSRRILAEGGYEAETAMIYYDRPGPLAPQVEDLIVDAVHRLVPAAFKPHVGVTGN